MDNVDSDAGYVVTDSWNQQKGNLMDRGVTKPSVGGGGASTSVQEIFLVVDVTGETVQQIIPDETLESGQFGDKADNVSGSSSIARRMAEDKAAEKFSCQKCAYVTSKKSYLRKHVRFKHSGIRYKCPACSYQAAQAGDVRRHHEAKHTDTVFKCEQCDFVARSSSLLKEHKRYKHNGKVEIWVCERCNFSSKYRSSLTKHVRTHDTVYKCEECKFQTKREDALKLHINGMHRNQRIKCDKCEFLCSNKSALNNHVKTVHLQIRYECDVCSSKFTRRGNLTKHKREQHPDQNSENSGNSVRQDSPFFLFYKEKYSELGRQHPYLTSAEKRSCVSLAWKNDHLTQEEKSGEGESYAHKNSSNFVDKENVQVFSASLPDQTKSLEVDDRSSLASVQEGAQNNAAGESRVDRQVTKPHEAFESSPKQTESHGVQSEVVASGERLPPGDGLNPDNLNLVIQGHNQVGIDEVESIVLVETECGDYIQISAEHPNNVYQQPYLQQTEGAGQEIVPAGGLQQHFIPIHQHHSIQSPMQENFCTIEGSSDQTFVITVEEAGQHAIKQSKSEYSSSVIMSESAPSGSSFLTSEKQQFDLNNGAGMAVLVGDPSSRKIVLSSRSSGENVEKIEKKSRADKKTRVYKCDECDYTARLSHHLKSHIQSRHSADWLECDQCEYKCKRKDILKKHVSTEHQNLRLKCSQCDHVTSNSSSLKKHVESMHEGKLHPCQHCDLKFKHKSTRTAHIVRSHRESGNKSEHLDGEESPISVKKKEEKKDRIKRPPSKYLLFCAQEQNKLMHNSPGISLPQLGKELSKKWNSLDINEKQVYEERYSVLLQDYQAKKEKESIKEKSSRPLNAFFYFMKKERGKVLEQNPGMEAKKVVHILKERWKNMPDSDKEEFRRQSRLDGRVVRLEAQNKIRRECGEEQLNITDIQLLDQNLQDGSLEYLEKLVFNNGQEKVSTD